MASSSSPCLDFLDFLSLFSVIKPLPGVQGRSWRVHLQEIHLQIQSFKIFKQHSPWETVFPRRTHECFKPQICKMAVSSSSQTDFPPDMKAGNRLRRPFQLLGSSLKQNNGVAAFGSWEEVPWISMAKHVLVSKSDIVVGCNTWNVGKISLKS